jgi:hypothetical protein
MDLARRLLKNFGSGLVFVLIMLSPQIAAQDAGFLIASANLDGSISGGNDAATSYQSTAEALHTLIELGAADAPLADGAIDYLATVGADPSTENLALRAIVRYRRGLAVAGELETLIQHRNRDGGFGGFPGHGSTPFDTAHALLALTIANQISSEILNSGLNYLIAQQSPEGGWSVNVANANSLEVTALVLDFLRRHALRFDLSVLGGGAAYYLYSLQDANGHWGDFETTAQALLALIPVTADASRYADALEFLEAGQAANLSWNNDVYTTALALRALKLTQSVTLPVDPNQSVVTGTVTDPSTGAGLEAVTVSLAGPDNVSGNTAPNGEFQLAVSATGSYTISLEKAGYQATGLSFALDQHRNVSVGTISLELAPDPNPQFADIFGQITEASSGASIAGAVVSVTGPSSASAVTDGSGRYSLRLNAAGNFTVTVIQDGFLPVSTGSSIELGTALNFSPQLFRLDEDPPADLALTARILDDPTGQAVAGALVTVAQAGQPTRSSQSDSNGNVSVEQIPVGTLAVTIAAQGFRAVQTSVIASAGSGVTLGDIRLVPAPTAVSLSGFVTDSVDGGPIIGVRVEVVGTAHTTSTDAAGFYQLQEIDQLELAVRYSATGFESEVLQVSLPSFQALQLDQQLDETPINELGVGILAMIPLASQYGAYDKALVAASFYNNSPDAAQLQLVMEVSNASGYLRRFSAVHQPLPGDIADSILVLPGDTQQLIAEFHWMTGAAPPGEYQLTIEAYDLDTLQLLAEKAAAVFILEDREILRLVGHVQPAFSNYQAQETVVLGLVVDNASNVAFDLPLTYRWRHPDGSVLNEGSLTVTLTPQDRQQLIELAGFEYLFDSEGDYILEIESGGDVIPDLVMAGKVSVAPAVRIDPSISVDPTTVLPDGDKRIRLDIKLSGREEG